MVDFSTLTGTPVYKSDTESDLESRVDRARRAAKRARELRPQWQSYARMILRQPKLRVDFTAGTPHTDGKTIWLRIPIELGDGGSHERAVCGKRDPDTKAQLCRMCGVLEGCQITMYHEVSHIAFNSFMELNDRDRTNALIEAVRLEAQGKPESRRIKKIEREYDKRKPSSFLVAAALISPWLQNLVNIGEDCRVNRMMMETRPGSRPMFEAQLIDTFSKGIAGLDGEVHWWRDNPLNMQATIAVYCKILYFDYEPYLDSKVVADMRDEELDQLCSYVRTSRNARTVFHHVVPVLERLRELGYCLAEEDIEDDPPPMPMFTPPKGSTPPPEDQDEDAEKQPGQGAGSGGGKSDPDDDEAEEDSSESGESDDSDDQDSESEDALEPPVTPEKSTTPNGTDQDEQGDTDDSTGDSGDSDESDDEPEDESSSGAGGEPDESTEDAEDQDSSEQESEGAGETGDTEEPSDTEDDEGEEPEVAPEPEYEYGTPEEVAESFEKFAGHDRVDDGKDHGDDQDGDGHLAAGGNDEDRKAVEQALVQEEHFDAPSRNVYGVVIRRNGDEGSAWGFGDRSYYGSQRVDPVPDLPETVLSPALQRLRILFTENKRTKQIRDLKGGRINGKVLGRRVPTNDERLFQKRHKPGKRDYAVILGGDVSGSTAGKNIKLLKASIHAQAELLHRLGIPFAVYFHTGDIVRTGIRTDNPKYDYLPLDVEIYEVKTLKEPWGPKQRELLEKIRPAAANLDGHTLEFYRKAIQQVKATDKIIMYYTDGAMPLENFHEELEILQREIKVCKQLGIKLVGVGIRNDDPNEHGLDTIRVDELEDVIKVVTGLEKRIS